jgi:DNA-binding CsgD family transcriptional regulator
MLFGALNRLSMVRAHQGDVNGASSACADAEELAHRGEGLHTVGAAAWMRAFLELSLGNARNAIDEMRPLARVLVDSDVVEPLAISAPIPDLIEALVAVGELDDASFYLAELHRRAEATQNPWALVAAARSRALVAAGRGALDEALAATDAGLRMAEQPAMPFERARTLLVRGVVQRRAKQRRAARASLLQALTTFDTLGAQLWADRTRAELARIGGRASGDELTPTEAQVAARAAAGETNRDIADALFMSVKTVEANLSRVYRKLDISSRRQLDATLKQQT